MVFLSIAKRYATGISFTVRSKIAYRRSPRARTPAAYFKARSRPFAPRLPLRHRFTHLGESDVQFVIKAKFDYRVDKRREKVQKNLKNLLTLRVRCGRLLTHL